MTDKISTIGCGVHGNGDVIIFSPEDYKQTKVPKKDLHVVSLEKNVINRNYDECRNITPTKYEPKKSEKINRNYDECKINLSSWKDY